MENVEKIEVPIGCAERLEFIVDAANSLGLTFYNGNRKDMLNGLKEYPDAIAFAVLATIMVKFPYCAKDIARFLQEMA